jgi:DNA processing protein
MALHHWLTAHLAVRFGSAALQQALQQYGTLEAFLAQLPASGHQTGLNKETLQALQHPDQAALEQALAWQTAEDQWIISFDDPRYPQQLKTISSPPLLLYVKGNADILNDPQIAMVGSRHPTAYGRNNAFEFAKQLSQYGIIVTSGLAQGIDTACHEGALHAHGQTIAVCGTGLDQVYPKRNQTLAHHIAQQGALVSEFPLGWPINKSNFPQRNRIISALSLGTLIIEASAQSGSLITARLANEQGREVMAIPGSIHAPQSKGCHELLRQGANLVESVQDILSCCEHSLQQALIVPPHAACEQTSERVCELLQDTSYQELLNLIDQGGTHIDEIIAQSQLTPSEVSSMLLNMELQNLITPVPGGYAKIK